MNDLYDKNLIYLMFDGECYKVGITKNLKERLKSIQTGNPNEVSVYAYKLYRQEIDNFPREQQLLKKYKKYKVRENGEWFSFTNEMLNKFLLDEDFTKYEKENHDYIYEHTEEKKFCSHCGAQAQNTGSYRQDGSISYRKVVINGIEMYLCTHCWEFYSKIVTSVREKLFTPLLKTIHNLCLMPFDKEDVKITFGDVHKLINDYQNKWSEPFKKLLKDTTDLISSK